MDFYQIDTFVDKKTHRKIPNFSNELKKHHNTKQLISKVAAIFCTDFFIFCCASAIFRAFLKTLKRTARFREKAEVTKVPVG